MFSGIIRHLGRIDAISLKQGRLTIHAPKVTRHLGPGDSIAIDGVCLTVTHKTRAGFFVDITPETIRRTAFRWKKPGAQVNLELSLRLSDRLHGHLVMGHVDAVGIVTFSGFKDSGKIGSRGRKKDTGWYLYLSVPHRLTKFFAEKGSWSVNGVSLTISYKRGRIIGSALIPETLKRTGLRWLKIGDRANIEVDVLARYALNRPAKRG